MDNYKRALSVLREIEDHLNKAHPTPVGYEATLELLEEIVGAVSTPITKPFWWDSNLAWGEVYCEADWLRIVYYNTGGHDKVYPKGEAVETQDRMLDAKGFIRNDMPPGSPMLPSFGWRSEHHGDGAPLVLREWLGAK